MYFQISGTAAKLGHPNAYHHCTLLAAANKQILGDSLVKEEVIIFIITYITILIQNVFKANYISRATASVRAPIRNLCDINKTVSVPALLSAVGYEYLRTTATSLEDGGSVQAMNQRGFQLVNPTEKWFPGINKLCAEFKSWEWVIGKTPKFTVEKNLFLKEQEDKQHKITLSVEVEGVSELENYII